MSDSVKTNDSRMFNADGSVKSDAEVIAKTDTANLQNDGKPAFAPSPDAIDFNTFVMSLASSVQIALGAVPHPVTNKTETNLSHAKQTIDILGLIEQKTTGNLNADESGLLKHLLYQLRMQYVELSQKK